MPAWKLSNRVRHLCMAVYRPPLPSGALATLLGVSRMTCPSSVKQGSVPCSEHTQTMFFVTGCKRIPDTWPVDFCMARGHAAGPLIKYRTAQDIPIQGGINRCSKTPG